MNNTTAVILISILDVLLMISALIYLYFSQKKIRKLEEDCQKIITKETIAGGDFVGRTANDLKNMIAKFNDLVLAQAQKSFSFAIIYSIAGVLFFMTFMFLRQPQDSLIISAIGSSILEFISLANFYLYGRASSQMALCHARLYKVQNFLLAISVCKDFEEGKAKEETCAKIALIIANYSENIPAKFLIGGDADRTKLASANINGSQPHSITGTRSD